MAVNRSSPVLLVDIEITGANGQANLLAAFREFDVDNDQKLSRREFVRAIQVSHRANRASGRAVKYANDGCQGMKLGLSGRQIATLMRRADAGKCQLLPFTPRFRV